MDAGDLTQHPISKVLDVIAAGAIAGTFVGWIPILLGTFATVLSIVWFAIQIYESRTFIYWKNNQLMKRKAKKIARLKAKEKILAAQILAIETVRSAKVEAREKVAQAKTEATLDLVHDVTKDTIKRL